MAYSRWKEIKFLTGIRANKHQIIGANVVTMLVLFQPIKGSNRILLSMQLQFQPMKISISVTFIMQVLLSTDEKISNNHTHSTYPVSTDRKINHIYNVGPVSTDERINHNHSHNVDAFSVDERINNNITHNAVTVSISVNINSNHVHEAGPVINRWKHR